MFAGIERCPACLYKNSIKQYLGLVVLLSGISCNLHAAIYKWVDKKGNVQYTQTPPPVSQDAQPILRNSTRSGISSIKALASGDKIFCGSLEVMEVTKGDAILEENLRLVIDDWISERNKLDQVRLKLPLKTSLKVRSDLDNQYAEHDCRVNWARTQLKVMDSFEYKSNKSYRSLEKQYNELKSRQEEECSTDPKKLGKTMLIGKEANDWGKCYDNYRYKMRDIKSLMKENRKSLSESY